VFVYFADDQIESFATMFTSRDVAFHSSHVIVCFRSLSKVILICFLLLLDSEKQMAKQEAASSAKNMALNVVKLCFQAILITPDRHLVLPSRVSDPIFDSSKLVVLYI